MQRDLKKSQWHKGLKRLWRMQRQPSPPQGFTLIELLVAALIGALVTMGLLYLVVELTQVNQTDNSRTETQRDIQQAMDYISQDLQEAVFVYDGACLQGTASPITKANFESACPGVVNHIPESMSTDATAGGVTPVLAFWRLDPLPTALTSGSSSTCQTIAATVATTPNEDVFKPAPYCESGKTYTLVVYGLSSSNPNNIWKGRRRIVRYTLSQFNAAGVPTGTAGGYVDPTTSGKPFFQQWPYSKDKDGVVSAAPTRPTLSTQVVLVDFVASGNELPSGTATNPTCASPSQLSPTPPSPQKIYDSFYACVRGNTQASRVGASASAVESTSNQEVLVTLNGDATGRGGFPGNTNAGRLSPLQARVLVRGILDKNPR